jgi:hypothetical protein
MSDQQAPCPHDDWLIQGIELIGHGTCVKCGERMRLSDLINAWKARIEREIKAALDQ